MFKYLLNKYDVAERELIVWKREKRASFKELLNEESHSFIVQSERNNRELALQEERIQLTKQELDLQKEAIIGLRDRRKEVVELQDKLAQVTTEAEREKYIGIIAEKENTNEILVNQIQVLTALIFSKMPDVNLSEIFKNLNVNVEVKASDNVCKSKD